MMDAATVQFEWAEGVYDIRFNYRAIDKIEREFGDEWSERLRDLFVGKTKKDLEFVTSLTTGATPEEVARFSPPIVPLVNALYRAWQLAWHGDGQFQDTEVNETAEKKFMSFVTSWMKRSNSG